MVLMTLDEAQTINKDAVIEDVLAIEVAIRRLTNNRFYRELNGKPSVRYTKVSIIDGTIQLKDSPQGLRKGDRIELGNSSYNEELLTIKEIQKDNKRIIVEEADDLLDEDGGLFITLVQYPHDVKNGAKEVLKYKEKMADKTGLKSISVARVTQTYYDVTANDNVDGIPASVFSFIDKYKRLSWGG